MKLGWKLTWIKKHATLYFFTTAIFMSPATLYSLTLKKRFFNLGW